MKDKLSSREIRFLAHYLSGVPVDQCSEQSGYAGKNKAVHMQTGLRVLTGLDLTMSEILDLKGLTDDLIAQKTLEGLSADKVEIATFRGHIGDVQAYPDYSTRAKYLEILSRLKGKFIERKELTGKDGGELTLVVKPAGSHAAGQKHTLEIDEL